MLEYNFRLNLKYIKNLLYDMIGIMWNYFILGNSILTGILDIEGGVVNIIA